MSLGATPASATLAAGLAVAGGLALFTLAHPPTLPAPPTPAGASSSTVEVAAGELLPIGSRAYPVPEGFFGMRVTRGNSVGIGLYPLGIPAPVPAALYATLVATGTTPAELPALVARIHGQAIEQGYARVLEERPGYVRLRQETTLPLRIYEVVDGEVIRFETDRAFHREYFPALRASATAAPDQSSATSTESAPTPGA